MKKKLERNLAISRDFQGLPQPLKLGSLPHKFIVTSCSSVFCHGSKKPGCGSICSGRIMRNKLFPSRALQRKSMFWHFASTLGWRKQHNTT